MTLIIATFVVVPMANTESGVLIAEAIIQIDVRNVSNETERLGNHALTRLRPMITWIEGEVKTILNVRTVSG